jgi:hypothetical protein
MWTCPKCHAKVDPSFEVCWQCGTTPDGVEDPSFVRADEVGPIEDPPVTEETLSAAPLIAATTPPNPFGPDVELVEAYIAEDRMQAHFLASELTNGGIPAAADSHEPNETFGGIQELPRVYVRAEDLDKARQWLAGFEAVQREKHPASDE